MAGVEHAARTVHAVVHGVVQGVGFRWFVRERARERDLAGWVKNRADGAVELLVQGSPADVAAFMDFVKTGPRGARVDRCDMDELDSAPDLPRPFDIQR